MRSPSAALLGKDLRELLGARSYLLFLGLLGPLVGQAFVASVEQYAEASGAGGGPAALAQGCARSTACWCRPSARTTWRRRCCGPSW